MRSRLKVVYWNNMPSPYVVSRFNEVAQRDAFDFEAWFDGLREADRSWAVDPSEWKFNARFIQGRRRLGHHKLVLPLAELRSSRPDVFICNYDRLHYVLGAIVGRSLARRTALRCLPSFDAWTSPSRIRDLARSFVFRAVDGAKVPGPDGSAYAGRYGLPIERTWTVTQSIDVAHYAQARRMDSALRAQRRTDLGVTGCVFIYVGRIWSGKGLDTLVSAYRKVRASNPDVSLLLVGDGPDQQRLQAETSDLSRRSLGRVCPTFSATEHLQYGRRYGLPDAGRSKRIGCGGGNGCRLARNQHFGSRRHSRSSTRRSSRICRAAS